MGFLKACGDYISHKLLWLTALVVFWGIWVGSPSFVLAAFDLNLMALKWVAKVISFLPYAGAADGIAVLLDNWVRLVKSATWFLRSVGGERVELALRTMAFEGIVLWWEVRLISRWVIGVLFRADLTGVDEAPQPVRRQPTF